MDFVVSSRRKPLLLMIRINFDVNAERAASGYRSLTVGSYNTENILRSHGGGAGEAHSATWNLSARNICPKIV